MFLAVELSKVGAQCLACVFDMTTLMSNKFRQNIAAESFFADGEALLNEKRR